MPTRAHLSTPCRRPERRLVHDKPRDQVLLAASEIEVQYGSGRLFRDAPPPATQKGSGSRFVSGEILGLVGESGSGKSSMARGADRACTLLGQDRLRRARDPRHARHERGLPPRRPDHLPASGFLAQSASQDRRDPVASSQALWRPTSRIFPACSTRCACPILRQPLATSAFRRREAARRHRTGLRRAAETRDLRRDHRAAGRLRAGPDHRIAAGAARGKPGPPFSSSPTISTSSAKSPTASR